jgi:glycosyltransferase involved in cell wall biosynthesis
MKILQIARSLNPVDGGPTEGLKQQNSIFSCEGHQVEIGTLDPPGATYLEQSSLPVHALGPSKLKYGISPRFVPWLRANANRYDAVIVHGLWQYHSFGTWRALRGSSTPYLVFTHGMLDPWFKKQYPLKHLKKWVYWPWAEYRVLRDAQAVLFTCEQERLLARSSFWLYRCNEAVVGYGTTMPSCDPRLELAEFFGRYPELSGKRLALFMGRIHPKKGCDLLINAFASALAQDSSWRLVVAGPDQVGWQRELTRWAVQLGVASRITWTGMLNGLMKWGALRAAEIFILPSHQENFGLAVAEALAVGVPVLISNKVNIWREIEADRAGIISEDTLQGTCNSLRSYLGMSGEQRLAMRRAAAVCFEQRFNIRKGARNLFAVLASAARTNYPQPT